jgi:hypothetical protein
MNPMGNGTQSVTERQSALNSANRGNPVLGDSGIRTANQPVSIPGLSKDLQGPDRLVRRNFTISRNQFSLPNPGMASTNGSIQQ